MKVRSLVTPARLLFLLSPMIGELLSGSAPPAEFFNPFGLLVLTALYGSGVILTRELAHRWGKGWPTVLLLGAAYGLVEEGLMVKSFFDPTWMDLGPLGHYGRWAGVNWVWSIELTIYHAVFSISIPILLVGLAFPTDQDRPWVGTKVFRFLWLLLGADVVFGFLALTPYRPPAVPYGICVLTVILLAVLARRAPKVWVPAARTAARIGTPRWFLFTGLGGTVAFFFLAWVLPNTSVPPMATVLLSLVLVAWLGRRLASQFALAPREPDRHGLALAAGALGFFIALAPLQELDTSRLDNTAGMTLVGLAAAIFLLWLWRRVTRPGMAEMVAAHI
jgi:hypothetical protein